MRERPSDAASPPCGLTVGGLFENTSPAVVLEPLLTPRQVRSHRVNSHPVDVYRRSLFKIVIAAIAKESFPDEKRVALIPRDAGAFKNAGVDLVVESGAGDTALHADSDYEAQGARIEPDRAALFSEADLLLTVRGPGAHPTFPVEDLDRLRKGAALVGFLEPLAQPEAILALADRGLTVFAMELIPRTTRGAKHGRAQFHGQHCRL